MKEVLDIDDAAIVSECRHGDREAMSLLYTRHAPRMLRLISRYVDDPDDAKDILHDGFIAAFTRIDTLHDPAKVDHWLATIMKNLSLKFLQEQSVVSILDEIPESPGDDCEIADIIDFETLEILISRLPDGYQKVFRLAVLENKSHKEIAQILGIAPNSSSSQLFHAKVLLRRLIAEYKEKGGALVLLLIAVTIGTYLYLNNSGIKETTASLPLTNETVTRPAAHPAEPSVPESLSPEPSGASAPVVSMKEHKESMAAAVSEEMAPDSIPVILAESEPQDIDTPPMEQTASASESSAAHEEVPDYDYIMQQQESLSADINPAKKNSAKGWSAGLSFDPGIFSFEDTQVSHIYENDWNDYLKPDPEPDPEPDTDQQRVPRYVSDYYAYKHRKDYFPIAFGLNFEKHITSWFGIETGLKYTYLQSDYDESDHNTRGRWHYIGIPLKANFYAYSSSYIRIYGSVGGEVAIPAYSSLKIISGEGYYGYKYGKFSSPVVWSLGGSIGVSVPLSKKIDIYVEPTVRYIFPHDYKVPNVWSDRPWTISIPIGVRFKW